MLRLIRQFIKAIDLDDVIATVIVVLCFTVAVAWVRTTEHRERINQLETETRTLRESMETQRAPSEWGQDSIYSEPVPVSVTCASCGNIYEMSAPHTCNPMNMKCTWPGCLKPRSTHVHFEAGCQIVDSPAILSPRSNPSITLNFCY